MPKITLIFAAVLILLGLVGYFGTPAGDGAAAAENGEVAAPKRSVTALIPAFVGTALLVAGAISMKESMRMHGMHAAVLIGLLGCLAASGRAIPGLIKMASGGDVNGRSVLFVSLMAILCGVYVAMCVNSFIQAKKRREAAEASA